MSLATSSATARRVGFSCRYTPLAMIHAAGLVPYRVLPVSEAPEEAGSWLHDNLCPLVKRILDRALADDLPELEGVVFMASCDAMRRLADAWQAARPADRVVVLDLPVVDDPRSVAYLAAELERLRGELERWCGRPLTDDAVRVAAHRLNKLAAALDRVATRAALGALPGGWRELQEARNLAVTAPLPEALAHLGRLEQPAAPPSAPIATGVPVLVVGNVLPDPAVFDLLTDCGARLVADDLCTGSRQLVAVDLDRAADGAVLRELAAGLLSAPPCARTLRGGEPGGLARATVERVRAVGAAGVIAHVARFCDPYLARLPALREALREAGLPLLVLEGDCTLRSLGQHRTRITAFVEMLGDRG